MGVGECVKTEIQAKKIAGAKHQRTNMVECDPRQ